MSKKSGSGLEKYVDKIALGVVGLIGLYVLYAYVLTSPTTVEYNGTKYNPSDLDKAIRDRARLIEEKLGAKEASDKVYQPKFRDFKSILAVPLKGINENAYIQLPSTSVADGETRVYDIPKVCDVCDVKARCLTSVAYVPAKPLDGDNLYATAETEQADLDFVTVEATMDAAELSKRFSQSFAAARNSAWAKPVFAAVELDRQELLKTGNWSDWQVVPRTKISEFRNRFNIPQKVSQLDKSPELLMLQFDRPEVKEALLQPRTYDFAYPVEPWLPPSLDAKRQEKLDKMKIEEQKKRRDEARKAEEERNRSRATPRTPSATGRVPAGGGGGIPGMPGGGMPGVGATMPTRPTQPARVTPPVRPRETDQTTAASRTGRAAKPSTVTPVSFTEEQEFAKERITDKTDFATMKELVLWAHDDTAESGRTYKYRLRVGVFNPVAGTNSLNERDKAFKDYVILWSDYSKETAPLVIPARWYFFPRDYREADKMVNMQVSRYLLAKWYSKNFRVKPGEVIGAGENINNMGDSAREPDDIDYANGTVLVDVVPVVDLDRNYADALYAGDTKSIEHVAIKQQYWPSDLKMKFDEIERLQKEPAPVLKARGSEGFRRPEPIPTSPGVPGRGPGMPGIGPGMPGMPGIGPMPGAP